MKKKHIWKSSEEKQKHEELEKSWKKILRKVESLQPSPIEKVSKRSKADFSTSGYSLRAPTHRSGITEYPSAPDTVQCGAKKESKFYTGSNTKGVGTLHKSNAVPVFSDDEARDLASMRR